MSKFFVLEITGRPTESEFFIAANFERTHVAPFLGTPLNPQFVRREGSPWDGAVGDGFDYLVNAEYFHRLVEEHTGLTRPLIFSNFTGELIDERALSSMESYYHQNSSLREYIDADVGATCIFAFEGLGSYIGGGNAHIHPFGYYGALMVVTKGKISFTLHQTQLLCLICDLHELIPTILEQQLCYRGCMTIILATTQADM